MRIAFLNDLSDEEIKKAEGVNLIQAYFRLLRKLRINKLPFSEYYIFQCFLKNRFA